MNAQTPAQIFRSLKQLPALQRDEAIAYTYVGLARSLENAIF
jgi:hypothetical protein